MLEPQKWCSRSWTKKIYFLLQKFDPITFLIIFRIVIVSSMAHQMARQGINFEDINYDTNFNTMKAYGISKLANVLHAKELANRLNNTGISVYVLHPGMQDF